MATPRDVAIWLMDRIKKERYLHQEVAADEIAANFGPGYVYENENGNTAIDRIGVPEASGTWARRIQ